MNKLNILYIKSVKTKKCKPKLSMGDRLETQLNNVEK